MGLLKLSAIFIVWIFSFLVFTPGVLPYFITSNEPLYQFTFIVWNLAFILAFVIFGLREWENER